MRIYAAITKDLIHLEIDGQSAEYRADQVGAATAAFRSSLENHFADVEAAERQEFDRLKAKYGTPAP